MLVSVRKGSFSALAVSIFGFPCAAYRRTPPRNPSISLPGRKIPPFRTETSQGVEFSSGVSGWTLATRQCHTLQNGRLSLPCPALRPPPASRKDHKYSSTSKSHSSAHRVGFVVGPSLRCGSPLHAGVSGNASSPRPIFSEGGPSTYYGVRLRRLLLAAL